MKTIGIIVPYFGKLPDFYKAWKVTAMKNSSIDFHLVTDSDSEVSENNIFVHKISFSEMKKLIQRNFDFNAELSHSYKLCDYKPAFGEIFKDIASGYDFWGYCDVDMLLGNIRNWLSDEILEKYERFFFLGHISIYKNCEKINSLYKFEESPLNGKNAFLNYDYVYTIPDSMYFDEARGMLTKCLLNGIKVYTTSDWRDPIESQRKFYSGSADEENQFVVFWENGNLYSVGRNNQKRPLIYARFYRRNFKLKTGVYEIYKIKVVPGEVDFNEEAFDSDFEKSEKFLYKLIYYYSILKNSIKRYGVKKTLSRQKWTRESNEYISAVRKEIYERSKG
ncbi:MAG: hypothetical protein LUG21_08755 [Clostridiales bacterium]|nr:hypothetical protein [Clostridiales bacterium]